MLRTLMEAADQMRIESQAYFLYRMYSTRGVVKVLAGCHKSAHAESLLRKYGAVLGPNSHCKGSIYIDNARDNFSNLIVGSNVFIGPGAFLDLSGVISLGTDVVLGPKVTIITHQDSGNRHMQTFYPRAVGPVTVGYGANIGANATILRGVAIGAGAYIGAGALVNRSVPPYQVWGGVPARHIKNISYKGDVTSCV